MMQTIIYLFILIFIYFIFIYSFIFYILMTGVNIMNIIIYIHNYVKLLIHIFNKLS